MIDFRFAKRYEPIGTFGYTRILQYRNGELVDNIDGVAIEPQIIWTDWFDVREEVE